jgi:hypothetical protein
MAFRVEPDDMPTRRVWTLEGRRTSWEELPSKWRLAVAETMGGRPRESLKGAEVCER